MIAVLDYGAGNLRSVRNSLDAVGANYEIVSDSEGLRRGSKIMLPGVGHFGQMMEALDRLGVRETLRQQGTNDVPFLGICLGMQALFEESAEASEAPGLGLLRGRIERFPPTARVPHMGWNAIAPRPRSHLFREPAYFYFAHSYYAPVCEQTAATTVYSCDFSAAVESGNLFGVQFHPEKSGRAGLEVLRRFAEL